jgi:hypothetical protein
MSGRKRDDDDANRINHHEQHYFSVMLNSRDLRSDFFGPRSPFFRAISKCVSNHFTRAAFFDRTP